MNTSEEFHIRNGWSKKRPENGQFLAVWPYEGEIWAYTMKWVDSPSGKRLMGYNTSYYLEEENCAEEEWMDITNDIYPEALYLQLKRF